MLAVMLGGPYDGNPYNMPDDATSIEAIDTHGMTPLQLVWSQKQANIVEVPVERQDVGPALIVWSKRVVIGHVERHH